MKKKLSMLVACAMLLALLAACGGNNGGNSGSNGGGNAQSGQDSGKSDGDKIVIGAAYYDLTKNLWERSAALDHRLDQHPKTISGSILGYACR